MTLSSAVNRVSYLGNGAVDTYAYTFRIIAQTDLRVIVRDTDGVETVLTLTTHYTVTGVGAASGGNVALVNGAFSWLDGDGDLKSGYTLTIRRVRPLTQLTDIRNQGPYLPEIHENAFDHIVAICQQQQDTIDRSIQLPESIDPDDFSTILPTDIEDSAGQVIIVNDDGDGFEMGPSADEISGAQADADAAAASATAAAASATSAATQATNSANSATASAASAASAAAAVASVMFRDVVFITASDSPYTITAAAHRGKMIAVDATAGAVSITLPAIAGLDLTSAMVVGIKKIDSGGNAVTINRASSDTIDGSTSKTLSTQNQGCVLIPDTDPSPDKWTAADFGAGVSAHSSLSGLTSGDDHTQYALLAGRATGQTLTGGTAANDNLTLLSTSHGTKGEVVFSEGRLTLGDAGTNAVAAGDLFRNGTALTFHDGTAARTIAHSATALGGDLSGTLGAAVVGDDSHSHTSSTAPGIRGFQNKEVFTANGTWTRPAGVDYVWARVWGSGGGADGDEGGGGGGGYAEAICNVSGNVTVTIGAGGTAGSGGGAGGAGGSTSFGAFCVVAGAAAGNGTAGGAGGIPSAGDLQITGEAGANGTGTHDGGACAGGGGAPGRAINGTGSGVTGGTPGGGGGSGSAGNNGGAGGPGRVVVYF